MKEIVLDIETDGIKASKIWCCVVFDIEEKAYKFYTKPRDLQSLIDKADVVVAHNGIEFDFPVLKSLWNVSVPFKKMYDTIVVSRLYDPKRTEGHSLDSWGKTLKNYKGHHEDWSHLSLEMFRYCKQDVSTTTTLYQHLKKCLKDFSAESIKSEFRTQYLLHLQRTNGFKLDVEGCLALKNQIDSEYMELIKELQRDFPPREVVKRIFTVKYRKDGNISAVSQRILSSPYCKPTDNPNEFAIVEYKEFCIDSPSEIVTRMQPYWKPYIFNKPSKKNPDRPVTPKVCIENLMTVPETAPKSIQNIVKAKILKSRSTLLQSFLDACGDDGRVHGKVISIGSITHRMAHSEPNTANIPSRGLYGHECRALWGVPLGYYLLGCDASGIQLRALAHYVGDEELIHQILNSDIHVHLAKVYGLLPKDAEYDENIPEHKKARSTGKTITYAILMGGGPARIGQILEGTTEDGKRVMNALAKGIHGWTKFKQFIEFRARIGNFKALDGSIVPLKSAHYGMSAFLQSFEQAVIKWVMFEAYKRLTKAGYYFKQVAVVHDEIQYEVKKEDAEEIGKIVAECFEDAGKHFKTKCPLAGEYKYGTNWADSH